MPYETKWIVEGAVIQHNFKGDLTLDDLASASEKASSMVASSDRPLVHVITDVTGITSFPKDLAALQRTLRNPDADNDRSGWIIACGINNPMLRFFFQALTSVNKSRTRMVGTRQEAIDFLKSMDSTLPATFPEE